MTASQLEALIYEKSSFLCVGLDTDISRIPKHLHKEERPVLAFNQQIVDYTKDLCVAYKINTAFYECRGADGWKDLEDTIRMIPDSHFVIADAKRGDIGNTSAMYAKAFFSEMNVDAITLSPYMGVDTVSPFLTFENKWIILLALTSNSSSADFQQIRSESGSRFYEEVLQISRHWGSVDNTMYVVGATHPEQISGIRNIIPEHFMLVPGVGAQGGDLREVFLANGPKPRLLVNSSRGIIFASEGEDFAKAARAKALELSTEMGELLHSSS